MNRLFLALVAVYLLTTPKAWVAGAYLLYLTITHNLTRNPKP